MKRLCGTHVGTTSSHGYVGECVGEYAEEAVYVNHTLVCTAGGLWWKANEDPTGRSVLCYAA
jgi:hypothetical protein